MSRLVTEIRDALSTPGFDSGACLHRVATLVGNCLHHEDLLTPNQMTPDPAGYRQHLLHAESDGSFSVVALVWLPGQRTPIHDHISWCVVGIYRGVEEEIRYEVVDEDPAYLIPSYGLVNRAGEVTYLTPPGDIHEVRGAGEGLTVSIHIYGADISRLGSSIRRCYPLPREPFRRRH